MKPIIPVFSFFPRFPKVLRGLAFPILVPILITFGAKPNIILIYTDDQGYGDVSALNPESKFQTPNIDRIANEGIIFTDGHSSDAICSPSRYSIMTGRNSFRTSLKSGNVAIDGPCLIAEGRMTLASLLQQNDYNTAMMGKWHLGQQFPGTKGNRDWSQPISDGPPEKGFDYYFGLPGSMNYGLLTYIENTGVLEEPGMWTRKKIDNTVYGADPQYYRMMPPYDAEQQQSSDIEVAPSFSDDNVLKDFTDKVVEFLGENAEAAKSGTPFFIYMPLTSPHLPHSTSEPFVGVSAAGHYGDFMMETDHWVGQVLNALDSLELADNTLVVFTSDNGPERNYVDNLANFGHDSNWLLREGKRSIHEGGHRVPFLMRWPDVIEAGRSSDVTVAQTDLLRTFADIIDVDIPENAGEDSYSLYPILLSEDHDTPIHGPVIVRSTGIYSIRDGDYKLIRNGNNVQLYNIADDIGEANEISGQFPEIVDSLTAQLNQMIVQGRSTPGEAQLNDGPQCWSQLNWMPACGDGFWDDPVDTDFWTDHYASLPVKGDRSSHRIKIISGNLHINLAHETSVTIDIYDIIGKRIYSESREFSGKGNHIVPLSVALLTGVRIYIVQLKAGDINWKGKVIL